MIRDTNRKNVTLSLITQQKGKSCIEPDAQSVVNKY